ncbi:hypothetical protein Tco_1287122 [Tanacetum coccineum]
MVVRSLDVEKDPFRPSKDDEDILGPEVPYLSAIGSLMFLASHTRPDISFSLNLLARYSSCPTRRHWNGTKQTKENVGRKPTKTGILFEKKYWLDVSFCMEEIAESVGKIKEFRRLCIELRANIRLRNDYISELRLYRSCDDILGSIAMLRTMQLDDTENAARL